MRGTEYRKRVSVCMCRLGEMLLTPHYWGSELGTKGPQDNSCSLLYRTRADNITITATSLLTGTGYLPARQPPCLKMWRGTPDIRLVTRVYRHERYRGDLVGWLDASGLPLVCPSAFGYVRASGPALIGTLLFCAREPAGATPTVSFCVLRCASWKALGGAS